MEKLSYYQENSIYTEEYLASLIRTAEQQFLPNKEKANIYLQAGLVSYQLHCEDFWDLFNRSLQYNQDNIFFLVGFLSTQNSLKKYVTKLDKYIAKNSLDIHEDGSMESPIPYFQNVVKKNNPIYSLPAKTIACMIRKELKSQVIKIIDIGTGPGQFAFELSKLLPSSCKIIGYDVSESMLDLAKGRALGMNLDISFSKGPVISPHKPLQQENSLPFTTNDIDFVISHGSMHHWSGGKNNLYAIQTMLKELYRILKPCGKILIYDINPESKFTRFLIKYHLLKLIGGIYQDKAFKHSTEHSLNRNEIEYILKICGFKNYKIYPAVFPLGMVFHVLEIIKEIN